MTPYPAWSIVYYCGQLWRVTGPAPGGLLNLRRCGWEHSHGLWGWDGYGQPINVAAQVRSNHGLLHLA